MKSDKQHFVDLGSKQKELERNDKARINQWAGQSKALEHRAHNPSLEEWDYLKRLRRQTSEEAELSGRQPSGKKGSNRPL